VGSVYNIGGGCEKRNIEVVEAICSVLAAKLKKDPEEIKRLITHIRDPRGEAHDFRYSLDCSRYQGGTGMEIADAVRGRARADIGVVSGEPELGGGRDHW
jgi:dTDP-D-glucose 4,6-dehydratase